MTTNVLIAFYSRGGVTEALATVVAESAEAEGPRCASGSHASLRR